MFNICLQNILSNAYIYNLSVYIKNFKDIYIVDLSNLIKKFNSVVFFFFSKYMSQFLYSFNFIKTRNVGDSLCVRCFLCTTHDLRIPLAAALYPRRWKERQAPGETFRFKVRLPTYRRKTCIKTFPEFSRFYGTGQGKF